MLKNILKISQVEFKKIFTDKRIIAIWLLIPLLYTLLFGYLYIEKSIKDLKVGVIDYDNSQLSRTVIEGFRKSEKFDLTRFLASEAEITPLMEKGIIDVALIIPEDFTKNIKKGKSSTIFIGANGANMTISNTAMTGAAEIIGTLSTGITMKKYEARGLLPEMALKNSLPITFEIRPWYNPTVNYSNFLLLGYIAAIVQQVTLYFASACISDERKNGALEKLFKLSRSSVEIILGKLIPYFLNSLLIWIASFGIGIMVFTTPMRGQMLDLLILSTAFFFCICSIGIFFSIASKDTLNATQYSMLVALPSFLICGFTWPLQAMPDFCKFLAHLLPLTYFVENVRKIALMDVKLDILKHDILILSTAGLVFLFLSFLVFKWKILRKGPAA